MAFWDLKINFQNLKAVSQKFPQNNTRFVKTNYLEPSEKIVINSKPNIKLGWLSISGAQGISLLSCFSILKAIPRKSSQAVFLILKVDLYLDLILNYFFLSQNNILYFFHIKYIYNL